MKNSDKKIKNRAARNKKTKQETKKSVKTKAKKKNESLLSKHRIAIIISVILFLLISGLGAKIFLYLNFILGNDIIIHLNSDKEDLSLIREQHETINFKSSITTNPFCNAQCSYVFQDISKNITLDYNNFELSPAMPITKQYVISIDDFGEGQKLYRFTIECMGSPSLLCHTKQESTSRTILVTAKYKLSEQEKSLKNELKQNLDNLKQDIAKSIEEKNKIELVIEELENVVYVDDIKQDLNDAQQRSSKIVESLNELKKLWDKQDYNQLNEKFNDVNKESIQINGSIKKIEENVSYSLLLYNKIASKLNETKQRLTQLNQSLILDEDITAEINKKINEFNSVLILFNSKEDISKKIIQVESLYNSVYILYNDVKKYEKREVLKKNIEVDINYEVLCILNKSCVERPSINERANQTEFNLKEACDDIEYLKMNYLNISANNSNNETINTVKQDTAQKYLNQLAEQGDNIEIIEEILLSYGNDSINQEYSLDNLFLQLVKDQPESCKKLNLSYNLISNEEIKIIKEKEAMPVEINIEFNEHSLKCCVFGECDQCCTTQECINDPSKFPVVFIHGHSVNKNTAADHSLDVFNKLQKELEKEGYLNAGSITLYTPEDTSPGAWGLMQTPVSIKASYYFDVFQEPENYLVVQTKSENIETYAVRMQEIINNVKHRTGKPKVILIAHSMGGLVSRRYLQIFGDDDVEKLIMIGTPNQGIEGDIAHMCPIIGSRYACRDMLADSLFMNKLNSGNLPNIEIYMIIGDGCELDGQPSDGTVLVKNARFEGEKVNNFVVNGTCEGIKKLHSKMLDPEIHPEVYEIILKALKD